MKLKQLKLLIGKGESDTLEFKKSTAQLAAAFATACAFLNSNGGMVLIGVTNEGKVIGQNVTDATRQEIANHIAKIEPTAQSYIQVHYVSIAKGKFIIVIEIKKSNYAPYIYDGRAFYRNQTTTGKMPQHCYEQLLVERGQLNHSWEEAIAREYTLNDLEHEEIYKTVADGIRENRIPASAQRESVREILARLNLIKDDKLTRAAIVLYAKPATLKFMQCMIKMARFKGIDKLGDFIDNQQLFGNAFQILEAADFFLRRHLPIASFFKPDQFKRIDKPALPVMAVREALINAICHRDYSDRYTDISLAIYDDRLEIWNSGLLLKKLTIENLKGKHESILRNKLIANAFYVRGMIEKWGSGTNKMIALCKQEGITEPVFAEYSGGLSVTFKFNEQISASPKQTELKFKLNDRQKAIFAIIKSHELINIQEITNQLQVQVTQRTVQKDLAKLRKLGLVKSKGRGKATRWILATK